MLDIKPEAFKVFTNEERARIIAGHFEPFGGWTFSTSIRRLEKAICVLLDKGVEPIVVELAVHDILRAGADNSAT